MVSKEIQKEFCKIYEGNGCKGCTYFEYTGGSERHCLAPEEEFGSDLCLECGADITEMRSFVSCDGCNALLCVKCAEGNICPKCGGVITSSKHPSEMN